MARTPRCPPLVSVVPGRQLFLRQFALLVESADGETAGEPEGDNYSALQRCAFVSQSALGSAKWVSPHPVRGITGVWGGVYRPETEADSIKRRTGGGHSRQGRGVLREALCRVDPIPQAGLLFLRRNAAASAEWRTS